MHEPNALSWKDLCEAMIKDQLEVKGIVDSTVLAVMREIPRHEFVDSDLQTRAYEDRPLPIGFGQSISQPFIVARMTELLDINQSHSILEIGTGCGYQTAILSRLCHEVVSVERIEGLAEKSVLRLHHLGIENVKIVIGDGSLGWPDLAPYDRIIVTAADPHVSAHWKAQLGDGGKMVVPVGTLKSQRLELLTKNQGQFEVQSHELCMFVPLIGEEGWS